MHSLLARFAECLFWMARYVERTENLARIIDVQETFTRDSRGSANWVPIVQINADEERFFEDHERADMRSVTYFYILDPENPTSVLANVRAARENARTLRPLISTEMWTQLNVLYNELRAMPTEQLQESNLSRLCARLKESCQLHFGITEGTFYRDQGWAYYQLGKMIERADQTTRILDIKYHVLLPTVQDIGSPVDVSQWNALLRSVASYHAFRRVYPRGMRAEDVAAFLLFNDSFPRSVRRCVNLACDQLRVLQGSYHAVNADAALDSLLVLQSKFNQQAIDDVMLSGLHEFSDWIQQQLMDVTHKIMAGPSEDAAT